MSFGAQRRLRELPSQEQKLGAGAVEGQREAEKKRKREGNLRKFPSPADHNQQSLAGHSNIQVGELATHRRGN